MRFLLVILILSASNVLWGFERNLICDEPYTFYPNYERRFLFEIGKKVEGTYGISTVHIRYHAEIGNDTLTTYTYSKSRLKVTDEYIELMGWRINRFTGKTQGGLDCRNVAQWKFDRALRELKEWQKEENRKKYKQRQEKLKDRKL